MNLHAKESVYRLLLSCVQNFRPCTKMLSYILMATVDNNAGFT